MEQNLIFVDKLFNFFMMTNVQFRRKLIFKTVQHLPVVDEQLVVLYEAVGLRVVPLHLPHEPGQNSRQMSSLFHVSPNGLIKLNLLSIIIILYLQQVKYTSLHLSNIFYTTNYKNTFTCSVPRLYICGIQNQLLSTFTKVF